MKCLESNISSELIEQIFEISDDIIYCKVCSDDIKSKECTSTAIYTHIVSKLHLDKVHLFYLCSQEKSSKTGNNISGELFDFEIVSNSLINKEFGNVKKKDELQTYFFEEIEKLPNFSTFTDQTQKCYCSVLKSFYLFLANRHKNTFSKQDVMDYYGKYSRTEVLSILQYLMKCHDMKFTTEECALLGQLKEQLSKEQKQRIDEELTEVEIYYEQFIKDLGYNREHELILVIEIAKLLNIQISKISKIRFADCYSATKIQRFCKTKDEIKLQKAIKIITPLAKHVQKINGLSENDLIINLKRREIFRRFRLATLLIKKQTSDSKYRMFLELVTLKQLRQRMTKTKRNLKDVKEQKKLQQRQSIEFDEEESNLDIFASEESKSVASENESDSQSENPNVSKQLQPIQQSCQKTAVQKGIRKTANIGIKEPQQFPNSNSANIQIKTKKNEEIYI